MSKVKIPTRKPLEFREVNGFKHSKSFKTPKGDIISVVRLNDRKLMVLNKKDGLTIQVDGDLNDDVVANFSFISALGGLIDRIKGVAGDIIGGLLGGSSGGCTQSTGDIRVTVTVSGDNSTVTLNPGSVKVDVQCQSPQ